MSNKINKTFISIVDADCEQFSGIMDEVNEMELSKLSTEELGKIKKILQSLTEMITLMIVEKHIGEAYDKGFENGKLSTIESLEENI